MTGIPDIMLKNGNTIPQFGFGVFQIEPQDTVEAVATALQAGYRGDIIFPKSVTPARIRENIDIFDFELSGEDVQAISALNRDERTGPDPDTFDAI